MMFMSNHTLLMSEKFRWLYEENGLQGPRDFQEVEVAKVIKHRRFRGNPPKYFKLTILRDKVRIDQQKSEFEWKTDAPVCPYCLWPPGGATLKSYKRLVIEEGSWNGNDIFKAHGSPESFLVTERFKNVCESNALKNIEFHPLETCQSAKRPWLY